MNTQYPINVRLHLDTATATAYTFLLHEHAPTDFTGTYAAHLDELNFYSKTLGDDVLLRVCAQSIASHIRSLGNQMYELTFKGEVTVTLNEEENQLLRLAIDEDGIDYSLYLESSKTKRELWSGDDWDFIENSNLKTLIIE